VTDAQGASTSVSGEIRVFAPLNLTNVVGPLTGEVPLEVEAEAAAVGGAPPLNVTWSFAPGAVDYAWISKYTYTYPGIFVVELAVTDSAGEYITKAWTIVVSPIVVALAAVSASVSPSAGPAPLRVVFGATPAGGTAPFSYRWEFGTGAGSTMAAPVYTYRTPGQFTAALTVTDARGNTATWASQIYVDPPLAASANASVANGLAPLRSVFAGNAQGEPPGTPSSGRSATVGRPRFPRRSARTSRPARTPPPSPCGMRTAPSAT
jgi:PKD repeat protein